MHEKKFILMLMFCSKIFYHKQTNKQKTKKTYLADLMKPFLKMIWPLSLIMHLEKGTFSVKKLLWSHGRSSLRFNYEAPSFMGSSVSKYEDVALTTNVLSTLCKWCAKVSRYFFKSAYFKYPNSKFTEDS